MPVPTTITRHELLNWLTERIENCVRLGYAEADVTRKAGWLQDAEYFAAAVNIIANKTEIGDYPVTQQ